MIIFSPIAYSAGFFFQAYFSGLGMLVSFAALILFFSGLILERHQIRRCPVKSAIYLIVIYSILSMIFTLKSDYNTLRGIFLNPAFILPYLCPLLTLKSYDYRFPRYIIIALLISASAFIFFSFTNFKDFVTSDQNGFQAILALRENMISFDTVSKNLGACLGFGLLLSPFIKKRYLLIILVGFAINLSMAIFLGRRNIIFTNTLYLVFGCYLYIRNTRIPKFFKAVILIFGLWSLIYGVMNFTNFLEGNDNIFFQTLSKRLEADTRGKVLEYYEEDMNSRLTNWVFGKGINSTYYCPGIEPGNHRVTVEAGWRHIILKIGLVGFFLYLTILVPPLFRKKNNLLIQACTIYIIIGIIELYPAGVPSFHLQYILLWITASFCYDNKFNKLSNSEVKLFFK